MNPRVQAENRAEAERLSAVVLASLDDDDAAAGDLARRAYKSRSHFFRLFQALIEESPGALRRRVLLERAAWQLGRTQLSVTEIALTANYGSLEAFSRAFRSAYRVSPSLYRRMGATHIHLPAPNGIHFCAAAGFASKGAFPMDLFDRFAGADSWHTRQLLQHAGTLSDEQLDRPLNGAVAVFGWCSPDKNLREMLDRIVLTKEVWTAALTGGEAPAMEPTEAQRTPAALLARFEKADTEFVAFLTDVRNRAAWDDTFIDALCEPPETFTFGGVFAHVMTFNSYRRLTALDALRRLGVDVEGFGCPMDYEMIVAPWRVEDGRSHKDHNGDSAGAVRNETSVGSR
jgi:AraC-like DNA-binding protein